jgi:hypothetical protein
VGPAGWPAPAGVFAVKRLFVLFRLLLQVGTGAGGAEKSEIVLLFT